MLADAVHKPRKLFLRKAIFQVHLWAGFALSLYVVVIALTGSVLVFENELTSTTLPAGLGFLDSGSFATIPEVMGAFTRAYPTARVTELTAPWRTVPAYQLAAVTAAGREFNLVADPATATLHAQPYTWVNWVHDLHVYLLLGSAHGEQVNAIGAAVLLLLALTGLPLWWQGLARWTRGLKLDLRLGWRRLNFDAHHAIGFWTLPIVLWWSISGVYFGCYRQFAAVVNAVSPLEGMASPPLPSGPAATNQRAPLQAILQAAQAASPHGRLFGISDPSLNGNVVYALMDLGRPADFSHRDIVTIDTASARVLTVWHYGEKHTLGDWIIWSMHPFHFGTLWGIPCKILWFLLGLALAALSVTGLLMYWNRYLRHHLRTEVVPGAKAELL